jgi:hypothetical protein
MNTITLIKIFSYLQLHELINCSRVHKQFNKISEYNLVWKRLLFETYDHDIIATIKKLYHITLSKNIYKKNF